MMCLCKKYAILKKSYTRVSSLLVVLYMTATALFAQALTLSFSGTPPYSAGEVFTVNARVSGAGVKNNDDFQIEIICPDCSGTQVQICDIIDATAIDGGTCLTPPVFTDPVDFFYGFQISGFCRVSNPLGVNNLLRALSTGFIKSGCLLTCLEVVPTG